MPDCCQPLPLLTTPSLACPVPRYAQVELPTGLSVVPGPAAGEGCSLEGGCASCPYMKMNSLQALQTGGWC